MLFLKVTAMVEGEGGLFCHPCYAKDRQVELFFFFFLCNFKQGSPNCLAKVFQARSKSLGPGDTSVIKGGGESCPRCGGAVFHAEKVLTLMWMMVMMVMTMMLMMVMIIITIIFSLSRGEGFDFDVDDGDDDE